jgi:hypothetical protein
MATAYLIGNVNSALSSGKSGSKLKIMLARYQTTTAERFLLAVIVALFPLEDQIPAVAGFSILYILFAALAIYTVACRRQALLRIWSHPVFLAGYCLVALAVLIESMHPNSSYFEIRQIGLMITGAICVAAVCRDRRALRSCMYGFLAAGVAMSIMLFFTTYAGLAGGGNVDFGEASAIRAEATADIPLHSNLNGMARVAAQGAVIALALAMAAKTLVWRRLLLGIMLFCSVAAFLPMSRSGVLILALSFATVMFSYGINGRTILISVIFGAVLLMWVPNVVFSRLTFSLEANESRAEVYSAVIEHFPEYFITGVGVGNFWGEWGMRSAFAERLITKRGIDFTVIGAHNGLAQITIYWGLAGLFALIMLIWQAYRCLPRGRGPDGLSLCVLGMAVSSFLAMMAAGDIYSKLFSLVLGMVVAGRCWIWPQSMVYRLRKENERLHAQRVVLK